MGIIFAFLSAAALGLNSAVVRRGVLIASPYYAVLISVTGGAFIFFALAFLTGQIERFHEIGGRGAVIIGVGGVINYLGARLSQFIAIGSVGANVTAPLRGFSSLFAAILGMTLLGEAITATRISGVLLLVAAPLIAFSRPATIRQDLERTTAPRLVRGIVFGLLSAGTYGISSFLFRWVLANTGLPFLGAFIAHVSGAFVLLAILLVPQMRRGLMGIGRRALSYFVGVLFIMAVGQVLWFLALEAAPISVVAPLVETLAFFGVGFAYIINRDTESFHPLVLAGLCVAVIGAIVIAL